MRKTPPPAKKRPSVRKSSRPWSLAGTNRRCTQRTMCVCSSPRARPARPTYKAAAIRDTYVVASLALAVVLLTLIRATARSRRSARHARHRRPFVLRDDRDLARRLPLSLRPASGRPELLPIVFIFLIALGSDYNIFLMSRLREEVPQHGTREGMQRALTATGPVITSAGASGGRSRSRAWRSRRLSSRSA